MHQIIDHQSEGDGGLVFDDIIVKLYLLNLKYYIILYYYQNSKERELLLSFLIIFFKNNWNLLAE